MERGNNRPRKSGQATTNTNVPIQAMAQPSHLVLLGDSIFDNAADAQGALDVVTRLQSVLPAGSMTAVWP